MYISILARFLSKALEVGIPKLGLISRQSLLSHEVCEALVATYLINLRMVLFVILTTFSLRLRKLSPNTNLKLGRTSDVQCTFGMDR